jgi:hypothetical protein
VSEQLYTVGIPMTGGYFTVQIEADSSEEDALNLIKTAVAEGLPLVGVFVMPKSPPHKPAPMIIVPANVLGYMIVK